MKIIAPSILSADFSKLSYEINDVKDGGNSWIHVDVMDGHFVPNLTMGPTIVKAVKKSCENTVDVHLMIEKPQLFIASFAQAGADIITVHAETCTHLQRVVTEIHAQGKKAGVALNPSSSPEIIKYILDDIDLILIMTVNPGFSQQKFLPQQLDKIKTVKQMLKKSGNNHCLIEVDGGINPKTAKLCAEQGADVFVSGSYIFDNPNRQKAINSIKERLS